jgi:hypothetical protein
MSGGSVAMVILGMRPGLLWHTVPVVREPGQTPERLVSREGAKIAKNFLFDSSVFFSRLRVRKIHKGSSDLSMIFQRRGAEKIGLNNLKKNLYELRVFA